MEAASLISLQSGTKKTSKETEEKDAGKSLFASSSEDSDSDDEDISDMFKSRPHLEGKKGEKVLFTFNLQKHTYVVCSKYL